MSYFHRSLARDPRTAWGGAILACTYVLGAVSED